MVALALAFCLSATERVLTEKDLPFPRVHGIAVVGNQWVVGGLRGLAIRKSGEPWQTVNTASVKQILSQGDAVWVLYGNGAVDKMEPKRDRLYSDVLQEAAKRPWTSSMFATGSGLVLGGLGGWTTKSAAGLTQIYPKELDGQVVTAAQTVGKNLWLGTQNGLFSANGTKLTRFGLASGLADLWVTALATDGQKLLVGLADGGLMKQTGNTFRAVPTPSRKVVSLLTWNGKLVLGTLEGTWLHETIGWTKLNAEETTCLQSIGGELVVGSPTKLSFFR